MAHYEGFNNIQGIRRISLETGSSEAFRAARELYKSQGYEECEAFEDYILSEHNTFMLKEI